MRLLALLLLIGTAHAQGLTTSPPGQGVSVAKAPLITDTANTVTHVWWSGGLKDTKALAWSMTGTVPQLAPSKTYFKQKRAGTGPYSGTQYYTLASPNALQFATGTFTACAVYACTGTDSDNALISIDTGTSGFTLSVCRTPGVTTTGGTVFTVRSGASVLMQTTIGIGVTNVAHVACFGMAAGTAYLKVDGGTTFSGAATWVQPAGLPAILGAYNGGAAPMTRPLFEFWASSDGWNESNVAALQAAAMAKFK
jgi:hypothetical protein